MINDRNDKNIDYNERLIKGKIYSGHSKLLTVAGYTMDYRDWSRYIGGAENMISVMIKAHGKRYATDYIEYVMSTRNSNE